MPSISLAIDGMSCGHCVASVRHALESVPGVHVKDVQVGTANLDSDITPPPLDAIKAAVEDAGYFAEVVAG